jgi:CPA1 family monovalent cation:H+ antiporter
MYGDMFVSITYIVVLFSIIIQGLTIGKFAKKLGESEENPVAEKRNYL